MEQKEDSYRPPSSFFYEMKYSDQPRMACNRTKCKLFVLTLGICTGGVFLVKYVVDHWSDLSGIS